VSVLARHELAQSPLADLHALASELGIEGFRTQRREQLIDAILEAQGGEPETPTSPAAVAVPQADVGAPPDEEDANVEGAGGVDAGGGEAADGDEAADRDDAADLTAVSVPQGGAAEEAGAALDPPQGAQPALAEEGEAEEERDDDDEDDDDEEPRGRRGRGRRDGESRGRREDEVRTGILDILPNGSGFLRADPYTHSRDDVYVSPAQIRRCELRSGDEVTGPVRPPRRSERYPSLVRVDAVNGEPVGGSDERSRFDELTPVFATKPLAAGEAFAGTPFGKGSRVAIGGAPGAGATRLLREVVGSVRVGHPEVEASVVLAGVRPEEVTEWRRSEQAEVVGGGFDRPPEELAQAAAMALERAKRVVERGGDALLVVDALDALPAASARRVFSAARATEEAGTLTIVAATGASAELQRMATTRIVLGEDGRPTGASGTLRADLLGGAA
jgi:transcription termination factor Rho